jgi:hypothetical protein
MAPRIALLALLALLVAAEAAVPRIPRLNKPKAPGAEEVTVTEHINGVYETGSTDMCNQLVLADWGYSTDINNPAMEEALVSYFVTIANRRKF